MNAEMDQKVINNIKSLGIDMIDKAGSGHPGIVLGAAPILYTLYAKNFISSQTDSNWMNRDRFVMSAGHGSALLYAMLFMTGSLNLEDLKNFRSAGSKTPGHPEYGVTSGVDASAGPLGQGIGEAVGLALGGKILESKFSLEKENKMFGKEKSVFNYHVYALCGDGDLMEGISYEAASLAGTWKLNNLIVLYDSNNISLDGSTSLAFTENVRARFEALNWDTDLVKDGTNINDIDRAIKKAKNNKKPTLIEIKTIIGRESSVENTNVAHGKPLSKTDIKSLKLKWGFPEDEFYVLPNIERYVQKEMADRNNSLYQEWTNNYREYVNNHDVSKLEFIYKDVINFDVLNYRFNIEKEDRVATRDSNKVVMEAINRNVPHFLTGSADLFSSVKNFIEEAGILSSENYGGKNIYFGVREHAMGAILNGLALTGFKGNGSTFLAFSDYLKPAIRMSSIMKLPVNYIFSHDNVLIGSDGITHQPVEQLAMLRTTPNLVVLRPADMNELIGCWDIILRAKDYPTALILSKTPVNNLDVTNKLEVSKGAYIVRKENQLHGIILATGSEVHTALRVANNLYNEFKLDLRVVSMPSMEIFESMDKEYKEQILPKYTRVAAIEFGSKFGFEKYVYTNDHIISVDDFGLSGTTEQIQKTLNISTKQIQDRIKNIFM
jgi:transketolase